MAGGLKVKDVGEAVLIAGLVALAYLAFMKFVDGVGDGEGILKQLGDAFDSLKKALSDAGETLTGAGDSVKGAADAAKTFAASPGIASDYAFGSGADQDFNSDSSPWNVYVKPQVDTGIGEDGNPTSWFDLPFLTPQQQVQEDNGTIAGTGIVSGSDVVDWAFANRLF